MGDNPELCHFFFLPAWLSQPLHFQSSPATVADLILIDGV